MTFKETVIEIGGLMRCEMETIREYIAANAEKEVPNEPLILDCKHCGRGSQNIIFEEGRWRWNHD